MSKEEREYVDWFVYVFDVVCTSLHQPASQQQLSPTYSAQPSLCLIQRKQITGIYRNVAPQTTTYTLLEQLFIVIAVWFVCLAN